METDHNSEERAKVKNSFSAKIEKELRRLRFQNYIPRAEQLKPYCADDVDPNKTLQRVIDKHEALIRSAGAKFMDPSLDFDNLLPKKSNTEFKHALSGKLERLHKRTRLALVEIARRKQMEDGDLTGVDVNDAQVSSDEEIQ